VTVKRKVNRKIPVIIYLFLLTFLMGFTEKGFNQETVKNDAFAIGEQLEFSVNFGPISAGRLFMTVIGIKTVEGFPCYHIKYELNSRGLFSRLFKVRDIIETYIDTTTMSPRLFKKNIHEGRYKSNKLYYFNHDEGIAYNQKDTVSIPYNTQDMLSIFYFLRTQDLSEGSEIEIPNFDNGKVFKMRFKIQKGRKVSVDVGTFDCIVLNPSIIPGEPVKPKADITVWLTDDERKIPVLIKTKLKVGSMTAKLTKMEGVK